MNEKGIVPPPKPMLAETLEQANLSAWDIWFSRLQQAFPRIRTYSSALDVASVAANTTAEQTFTVAGLSTKDIIYVNKPSNSAGLGIVNCRVSAANTLAITFMNATGSAIDPGSETYLIVSVRL
jgi:hypothetical protein